MFLVFYEWSQVFTWVVWLGHNCVQHK
jgi:hypothetical protein